MAIPSPCVMTSVVIRSCKYVFLRIDLSHHLMQEENEERGGLWGNELVSEDRAAIQVERGPVWARKLAERQNPY